ncbi:MAG: cytochrome c3 family protein [Desulfobacteraceae bacterium]|nr:cytochrome c3 family protein [Desulfobacteraceae bacterium]
MNCTKHGFKKILSVALAGAFLLALGQTTRAAEKPYDEDTYGPAKPIVFAKPVKGVVFTHKIHTMDAGLACDSCHSGLFEMAAGTAEQNPDFTMKSLYEGKYCGACHDGSMAFSSKTRCTACHAGVHGYNKLMGAAPAGEGHGGH